MPTFVLFKNDKEVNRLRGANREQLEVSFFFQSFGRELVLMRLSR